MQQQLVSRMVSVISPGPMLDNYNASEMVDALMSARAGGFKYVIIDMAKLEFISSAGVGSVLGTVNSFKEVGGDIIFCNVSPSVLHVLKALDLDTYFTIRSTRDEAMRLSETTA
jgi:anti-anti-sigma factor